MSKEKLPKKLSNQPEELDLFKLHDEKGIPLSISLMVGAEYAVQGLARFFCKAMIGGWTPERAFTTIESACRDVEVAIDMADFKYKVALLWARHKDWSACADACR